MRLSCKVIKKLNILVVSLALAVCLACLAACGSKNETAKIRHIKVSLVESSFFTAAQSCGEAERGADYVTELYMRKGYSFVACDYADYTVTERDAGVYVLTLKNITRPVRVTVTASRTSGFETENKTTHCSIIYNYNDGTGTAVKKDYTLSYHIRPNTWNVAGLQRKGYTLCGWNTKPDGTGQHIGLGSRTTVGDGQSATLYCEWIKWLPESDFITTLNGDDTLTLIGYRGSGDGQFFSIPAEIGGRKVTRIESSFTTNIPCGRISSPKLLVPSSIAEIEDYAFYNSDFEEMYFFDNLEKVSAGVFSKNIKTYHINAAMPPRLQNINYNVRFADNLDFIIANADKDKIIFFGGCSLAYGLYSPMVESAFDGKYAVINAGLNGEFNALFQMQCMLPYIKEGDIFVHAPEQMNPYQFLDSLLIDSRVFAMAEGNYDLLADADFSYTGLFLDGYMQYKAFREEEQETDYSQYPGDFNTFGDYLGDRQHDEQNEVERDTAKDQYWVFAPELITKKNVARLADIYEKFEACGARVLFSYAPMNAHSVESDTIYESAENFENRIKQEFAPYGIEIISDVKDYIFAGRYFFDTDYHLNFFGAELRTEQLIKDLKKAGV